MSPLSPELESHAPGAHSLTKKPEDSGNEIAVSRSAQENCSAFLF